MSRAERPVLSRDLGGTVAHAGIDPTVAGRALQDALRAAIANLCKTPSWRLTWTSDEEAA
jgi:hypothetical protein